MASMLAILAHDPDTGIINYGHANVMHKDESAEVLEFLDFYKSETSPQNDKLRYLVFDSKFTNYENLKKLDSKNVKFITIRRRGKNIVDRLEQLPAKMKKTIRVEMAGNKKRSLKVLDEEIYLKGYEDTIRQISITGHGKIKPAILKKKRNLPLILENMQNIDSQKYEWMKNCKMEFFGDSYS